MRAWAQAEHNPAPGKADYLSDGLLAPGGTRLLAAHFAASVSIGSILSHFRQTIFVRPVRSVIAISRRLQSGQRLASISMNPPTAPAAIAGCPPQMKHRKILYLPGSPHVSCDTISAGGLLLSEVLSILVRKLEEHSRLSADDRHGIMSLSHTVRRLEPNEDLIRQGDDPSVSALVTSGMVARYHLLPDGKRQYLSFHLTGDMPDSQALFIQEMDHAVCAIGPASVALIEHKELLGAFKRRPSVSFAIWRETLIDAAIFREAITNNSARTRTARMAHLFCELYYRAKASGLTEDDTLSAPISLVQLGETLGLSIATVNRALNELRKSQTVDFHRGTLHSKNWDRLRMTAQFNPMYLHLKKAPL
jgi:CRP-like cAMP-binding protein